MKISLLLAVAPLAASAAGSAVDCGKSAQEVESNFKDVIKIKPEEACQKNVAAKRDKEVGQTYTDPTTKDCGPTPDGTVCLATYRHLKSSIEDYRNSLIEACQHAAKAAADCAAPGAALGCAAAEYKTAADANARAQAHLADAVKRAEEYKKLTARVITYYNDDQSAIDGVAQKLLKSEPNQSAVQEIFSHYDKLQDGEPAIAGPGPSMPTDVLAANGGASTIQGYKDSVDQLKQEQTGAASAVDTFNKIANQEIANRKLAEASLRTNAATALTAGNKSGSIGQTPVSNITGASSPTATTPAASPSDGSSPPSAASAGSLASTAGAAAKAAGAAANASTGASSAPPSEASGGEASPPSAAAGGSTGASQMGSGSNRGTAPSAAPPSSANAVATGDAPAKASPSYSVGVGWSGGRGAGVSTAMASARGGKTSGTAASSAAADAGAGKDGRSLASAKEDCAGPDCAAMNDLKTPQFNAVGALGTPRLGGDQAFSTSGALDGLLSPAASDPALAALKPLDPVKSAGGLLDEAFPSAGAGELAVARSSTTEIAAENTVSLFSRVHLMHERALQRGAVSLFHKKL